MTQNNSLTFENHPITIHHINGQEYLSAADISKALGFEKSDAVTQIYHRYQDEFEEETTQTLKLSVSGNYVKNTRVFNRRGAWLIAIFAKTPAAKKFRKWVLDVLENHIEDKKQPEKQPAPEKLSPDIADTLKALARGNEIAMKKRETSEHLRLAIADMAIDNARYAEDLRDMRAHLEAEITDMLIANAVQIEIALDGDLSPGKTFGERYATYIHS